MSEGKEDGTSSGDVASFPAAANRGPAAVDSVPSLSAGSSRRGWSVPMCYITIIHVRRFYLDVGE